MARRDDDPAVIAALVKRPCVSREVFARHLDEVLADDAIAEIQIDDLALAVACSLGDPGAVRELEALLESVVPKALTHVRPSARRVDEVRQELRDKLLVADVGAKPKILEFRGRGPLGAWLRVVALRAAYADLREESSAVVRENHDEDALLALVDQSDDPEVSHLRTTYAAELKAAFAIAVETLSTEERAVLRSAVVDELSVDAIGALYQVHRATAARWVASAKATLSRSLRAALAQRLGTKSYESVVGLVESRIDLSLDRLLREP